MTNPTDEDALSDMMSVAADERKQRKRLQNRINQRARRLRMEEQGSDTKKPRRHPYQVNRWRVSYPDTPETISRRSDEEYIKRLSEDMCFRVPSKVDYSCWGILTRRFERAESPSCDHLLNLVQFNVMRGFVGNKTALAGLATYFTPGRKPEEPHMPFVEEVYPGRALLVPTASGIPANLAPTRLQISTEHSIWIDLLPFPQMRDNLIRWEAQFDHAELAGDIVGDLLDRTTFFKPPAGSRPPAPQDKEDESSDARGGLIIWGEPHDITSWEVTAGFVKKWGWALEGCQDLIESSNRWRLRRGERPLVTAV